MVRREQGREQVDGSAPPAQARFDRAAPAAAPRRGRTVRAYLLVFACAALLPAWALTAFGAWRLADEARQTRIGELRDSARGVATDLSRELATLRATLLALATSPALAQDDLALFHRQITELPTVGNGSVALADAEGRLLASSRMPFGVPYSFSAASLAVREAALAGGGVQVSGLVTPPGNHLAPAIVLAVAVVAPPGAPGRVLMVWTDALRFWSAVLAEASSVAACHLAIVDAAGTIIAYHPEPEALLGQTLHPEMRTALQGSPSRGGGPLEDRDGQPIYAAWHAVPGASWTVVVSVPTQLIDGLVSRHLLPLLIGCAVLLFSATSACVVWGARRIAMPLATLEAAAIAFGRGEPTNPPEPSKVREIDAVARALAAAGLERAEREADRTALAIRLEAVLESTTDSVAVLDGDWRFAYLNGRAAAMLGGGGRLLGRAAHEVFPEFRDSAFEATYRRARQTAAPQSVTAFHIGLQRWLSADVYPSADGVTVFFRDVTEAKAIEAQLAAVMEHVPIGLLLVEAPSGRALLSNRHLEKIVGYPVAETAEMAHRDGRQVFDADGRRLGPADLPIGRVLAQGQPAEGELRYVRAGREAAWVRASASPIHDAAGRMTGVVLAVTDITEARRAAEALRESEARFRTLSETVPQIVWSSAPDGVVDYVNPRFAEFVGPAIDDPSPGGPASHPEDAHATRAIWRAALLTGEPFAAEYRLRGADGVWRWFAARALPIRGADRAIARWIGAATDITDLVNARVALENQVLAEAAARQAAVAAAEALAASEERFRRFAEASPDVLWIMDAACSRLEYVSPAFERIWGVTRAALHAAPENWTVPIHPEDRAQVEAARAAARRGVDFDCEYRVMRGDGTQRWVRDQTFPILDAAGRLARRGGFARDVTAAKAAEERQRLLIGELNHRVKNTLATVHSLALQTARAAGNASDPLQRFLADFQARLLALARAHDVLTARTWRGATLADVAHAALAPWQPDGATGLETARLSVGGPPVWLAPRAALALSLALHELATNAAKHGALSLPDGQVALSWSRAADDRVELVWQERGGPPVREKSHQGFGTRLLERGLPNELGAGAEVALVHAPGGLCATMRFRPSGPPPPGTEDFAA